MRRRRNTRAVWPLLMAALLSQSCSDSAGEPLAEPSAAESRAEQNAGAPLGERSIGAAPASSDAGVGTLADLLRAYDAQCPPSAELSLDCEWLRSLLVADVVERLEVIERSRDQRGAKKALAALDVLDEPEILIAACRILGEFVDTPGLAEKVTPLLDSPYLEVQRIASDLLGRVPNSVLNAISYEWSENHAGAPALGPYEELDFPAHYAGMGFPAYPGAGRYTPADSDRSIGWWSTDPAATVATRLGEAMGVEVMTAQQWAEHATQQTMQAFQSTFDPSKMEELQKLTEQYMKTPQDEAILKRIEKLQAEIAAPMEQAGAAVENGVDYVATPSGSAVADQIYYLIAEQKPGHVARLVLVYRQPGVERTVVQMSWNLGDYPPVWGEGASGSSV